MTLRTRCDYTPGEEKTTVVCCICQRVRTIEDRWEHINLLPKEDGLLSHGFCPQCVREHYPSLNDK